MKLLKQVSNNIHKAQFLPWIHPQDDSINASDFWCFIDRSSLFYLMKRLYKRNPYYEFIENIDFLLKLEENTLKHMNFEPTPYFQVFMYDMGASIYLFHWVTNQSTSIDEKTLYFLQNYDVTLCI